MSEGELVVITIRLTVPLLILRFNLLGGLAAVAVDALDVVMIEVIGLGGFGDHYSQLDKGLDTYYLTLELIVAWGWTNRWTQVPAILFFLHRVTGVVVFELTGTRWLLLVFPNMFENWWLYCVAVTRFRPQWTPRSWRNTLIPIVLLLVPKLGQEYLLHYAEVKPWDWTKRHILGTS